MEGMTKEIFIQLDSDAKLSVLYEMITVLCVRTERLEKYKWWNRALIIFGSAIGGGIMIYLKGVL